MKNQSYIHKLFGGQLQRQMDEDMEELIQAEQHSGQKMQPAYINEDYFKEQKREKTILNRQGR